MKIVRMVFLACGVLSFWSACFAQGPFTLKIAINSSHGPVEPLDRTFEVQERYPSLFQVIVTNTDSSAQQFYENASSGGYSSISFEITDENGKSNVVRKKKDTDASSTVTSTYLNPQEKRVFGIRILEDTWENAYKLHKQGARKFKVRAIYDNNGSAIYSEYYNLEVTDSSSATETEESSQGVASSGSSVLVSQ